MGMDFKLLPDPEESEEQYDDFQRYSDHGHLTDIGGC